MQLNINDAVKLPVEQVRTYINVDEMDFYSPLMAAKLAKKHYEKEGWFVLIGLDFENNMLIALNSGTDKKYLDDYTKIKIGRAKITDDINIYADQILPAISRETTDVLLHLCRLCSYSGDPAFPELILTRENDWHLRYVVFDELQLSQKLFLILAKLLDIDIQLSRVVFTERNEIIDLIPSAIFSSVLSDSRALSVMHGIEEGLKLEKERLHEARNTDELASVEDEISYLLAEKQSKPFHLLQKWLAAGFADSEDIIESMTFVVTNNEGEKNKFEKYAQQLAADPVFLPLSEKKAEDAMRQKAAYFQKKFGIGPSRAKALLRFLY